MNAVDRSKRIFGVFRKMWQSMALSLLLLVGSVYCFYAVALNRNIFVPTNQNYYIYLLERILPWARQCYSACNT